MVIKKNQPRALENNLVAQFAFPSITKFLCGRVAWRTPMTLDTAGSLNKSMGLFTFNVNRNHLEILLNRYSDSEGLGQDLRFCISGKL